MSGPTIAEALAEFLSEEQQRLAPRTFAGYREVVELLQHSLNGSGYDHLTAAEQARYDGLPRDQHGERPPFCEVFGPEHITANLDEYLNYFLIRKVAASQELGRTAGTVTGKLAAWLAQRGYASAPAARSAVEAGAAAHRNLPRARKLTSLLHDLVDTVDPDACAEVVEDHFTITRVGVGKIWLQGLMEAGEVGPIRVPAEVNRLCEPGWTISGTVGRTRQRWDLVEVWNVYPR